MPALSARILAKLHKIRRCTLSTILALTSGLAIAGPIAAQDAARSDVMFVQSAPGITYDPATRTLTLMDVNSVTVFFSSGTPPLAGNMLTSRFVELWNTQDRRRTRGSSCRGFKPYRSG